MTNEKLRELEEEFGVEVDANFDVDCGCNCEACADNNEARVREHLTEQVAAKVAGTLEA